MGPRGGGRRPQGLGRDSQGYWCPQGHDKKEVFLLMIVPTFPSVVFIPFFFSSLMEL